MGNYFNKKILSSSSSGEFDPLKASSKLDVMAERNSSDIEKQQISEKIDRAFVKIETGFREFYDFAPCLLDRQRELEAALKTSQDRLRQLTREHARQTEIHTENISSTNRPSDLERKYEHFCAYQRLDFTEFLRSFRLTNSKDKWTEEYKDTYVACIIFERSYEAARSLRNAVLSTPLFGEQSEKGTITGVRVHIDKNSPIRESLKVILKETAGDSNQYDVSSLVEKTLATISEQEAKDLFAGYDPKILGMENLKKYVKECCSYTWKLVCQTSPYQIEGNLNLQQGRRFSPLRHQVCSASTPTSHDLHIHAVIWPGLLGPSSVIRKAEVLLSEK